MKKILQSFLLVFPLAAFAQKTETTTKFLSGKIDQYPIEMIFETTTFKDYDDQTQTAYNIRYYYLSQLRPINLWGQRAQGDSLIFSNDNDYAAPVEYFRGKLIGDQFVGIWVQENKKLPFQLKVSTPTVPLRTIKKEETLKDEQKSVVRATYTADLSVPENPQLEEIFIRAITGGALGDINLMMQAESKSFFADYFQEEPNAYNDEEEDLSRHPYEFGSVSYPLINSKDYLILAHSHYQYTGGAHGMYHVTFYNYSHAHKRILDLHDILDTKSEEEIAQIIKTAIRKKYNIPETAKLTEGEESIFLTDDVYMSENFAISKNGITFYYGLYELTPYVFGMFEIFVPFESLKPYVKKF